MLRSRVLLKSVTNDFKLNISPQIKFFVPTRYNASFLRNAPLGNSKSILPSRNYMAFSTGSGIPNLRKIFK